MAVRRRRVPHAPDGPESRDVTCRRRRAIHPRSPSPPRGSSGSSSSSTRCARSAPDRPAGDGAGYAQRMRQIMPDRRHRLAQPPRPRVARTTASPAPASGAATSTRGSRPATLVVHHGGLFSRADLRRRAAPSSTTSQLDADDPACEFLAGMRSLVAIPLFDQGVALNMVVAAAQASPARSTASTLPEHVWMSNLFGRATHNLVLAEQVREAYDARRPRAAGRRRHPALAAAARAAAASRRSTWPRTTRRPARGRRLLRLLPAARRPVGHPHRRRLRPRHARRGDDGRHAQHRAHAARGPPDAAEQAARVRQPPPAARYTNGNGTFVTAFYGIYDPRDAQDHLRQRRPQPAAHPPRHGRAAASSPLDCSDGLPLGIDPDETYADGVVRFGAGDAAGPLHRRHHRGPPRGRLRAVRQRAPRCRARVIANTTPATPSRASCVT